MNLNTFLLILLTVVIVSPKIRKRLNRLITKLSSYTSKLLVWVGIIIIVLIGIAIIVLLIKWIISLVKSVYAIDPVKFKVYAVIIPLVVIPYIFYSVSPKLRERIRKIRIKSQLKLTVLWSLIIISITLGIVSLIAYFCFR